MSKRPEWLDRHGFDRVKMYCLNNKPTGNG